MDIFIVPHVQRQEVYGGQDISTDNLAYGAEADPYDDSLHEYEDVSSQVRTSPVNFFAPKMGKYPLFADAQISKVTLDEGDCIFVPAYNYYQFRAMKFGPNK